MPTNGGWKLTEARDGSGIGLQISRLEMASRGPVAHGGWGKAFMRPRAVS